MSEPFPWADVMRFGLGTLRLSPAEFWKLTVPELQAAASALVPSANAPTERAGLEAMLRAFPDNQSDQEG
ncbi:MAG: rcc01693 family protein [Pseudomonadota bacterium]